MIELNLLPQELRKKEKKQVEMPKIPIISISIGIIGILILSYILLNLFLANNRNLLIVLTDKWQQMDPQKKKVEKIVLELSELEKQAAALKKVAKPDMDWTDLLSGLNKAMIPNVWLSDMKLVTSKEKETKGMPVSLAISGYVVGKQEEQETSIVAKFITSLKAQKEFYDNFKEVELKNMSSKDILGEEVMLFKLDCSFKIIESVSIKKKKTKKKK